MSCADKGCSNRARIVGIGACKGRGWAAASRSAVAGEMLGMLGYSGQECVYVDVRLDCDCDGRTANFGVGFFLEGRCPCWFSVLASLRWPGRSCQMHDAATGRCTICSASASSAATTTRCRRCRLYRSVRSRIANSRYTIMNLSNSANGISSQSFLTFFNFLA